MTKEEQNQIIKDAWVRRLQSDKDIPEDIGSTYVSWLKGKIKQAVSMLTTPKNNDAEQAPVQLQSAQQAPTGPDEASQPQE